MTEDDQEAEEWAAIYDKLLDDEDESTDDGNLMVKIQLPERDEEIEWGFKIDKPNADTILRSSLRKLLSGLEPGEEVIIDLQLRLSFEPESPVEREQRELLDAQEAVDRLNLLVAQSPTRTLVFGTFDPSPNSPTVFTPPNGEEQLIEADDFEENTDVTQCDSPLRGL